MLILNSQDVKNSLPMNEAIEGMRKAFRSLANGDVTMPERMHVPVDRHHGEMLVMPAFVGGNDDALAVKIVGVFPENSNRGLANVMGAVCVFEPESCRPIAFVEGASLTGIRTAAVSGLATDIMANPDARSLAILGTGVQARTHIEAVAAVRNIETIRLYGRDLAKAELLKSELQTNGWKQEIQLFGSADEAVSDADVVCTVTSSQSPLFDDGSLKSGTHINVVGSHSNDRREVPSATVARAKIVVDQIAVALKSGDLAQPISEGVIAIDAIDTELGELVAGHSSSVRSSREDVTLFKSVGLALEDAAAAQICVANAMAKGIGQIVNW